MEKKDVFIAVLQPEDESARQRAELLRKYVMPHKNLIYSICIKYTYNQEDIEDNYLEALANFFKYMDSYDPYHEQNCSVSQNGQILFLSYSSGFPFLYHEHKTADTHLSAYNILTLCCPKK